MKEPPANPSSPAPNTDQEAAHPNALQAYATLGRFLEEDDWHPQVLEGKYIYRTNFNGKNGVQQCYARILVKEEQFLFYAVSPVKTPEEVRLAVTEFITRANYGMRIGNFELDYSDGEVRYKASLNFENEPLTYNLIRNTIYPAVLTLDRYLAGLMGVMYGGRTPVEAIQEIEG